MEPSIIYLMSNYAVNKFWHINQHEKTKTNKREKICPKVPCFFCMAVYVSDCLPGYL